MSDSPDKENNRATPTQGRRQNPVRPSRIPLPFAVLIVLLISGIALFAILFALQFFYTRDPGQSVPVTVGRDGRATTTGQTDGAPVSILPEAPEGVTILEKQAEAEGGEPVLPAAPVAQGAGIATGFAMDLGAADSFIELTRRFAAIVTENGESNFQRLEPRAVLRETVSGLEARLLVGPFDSEAAAADACQVLVLDEGIDCKAHPFEGELIARE